jgi:hypothetical protein
MTFKLEDQPIVVLADCLRKAESSRNLARDLNIHDTTVYGWLRFSHGISEEYYELLKKYRSNQIKKLPNNPQQNKNTWSRKESGLTLPSYDLEVRIIKHGLSKDDTPYVFAKTAEEETVFIPSFVAYEIVKQLEYIKVNDIIMLRVVKDLSNRSDYVAKKFLGLGGK